MVALEAPSPSTLKTSEFPCLSWMFRTPLLSNTLQTRAFLAELACVAWSGNCTTSVPDVNCSKALKSRRVFYSHDGAQCRGHENEFDLISPIPNPQTMLVFWTCGWAWGHLPFSSNLWPPPRCPPQFSIVSKAVVSPPPVTSPLLPLRQLLSPSIFNGHYLEMNGHLQTLHRLCCYITANMGLE